MAGKRVNAFTVFLILMLLIAFLGIALMIVGGMTYKPMLPSAPWTVAGLKPHG